MVIPWLIPILLLIAVILVWAYYRNRRKQGDI